MSSTRQPGPDDHDEAFWKAFLTVGHPNQRRNRLLFSLVPRGPRCRFCAAPFGGIGAPLMRLIGRYRANQNPSYCAACFTYLAKHHGGAEIECSMLFADIRGSTTIAESMSATAYRELLDRFYTEACSVVFGHDGTVDKFVGDELVAIYLPLLAGERHAALAIDTARELLRVTGHGTAAGPWVRLGIGVHTATAWFGAVGHGAHVELTAVGDAMNVAARLASMAGAGEVLVTSAAASATGRDPVGERRILHLKGRQEPMEVISLREPAVGESFHA